MSSKLAPDSDGDARDRAADERERAADERERTADEREISSEMRASLADERDRIADERDIAQDRRGADEAERQRQAITRAAERERIADERERAADERERAADARERLAEQHEVEAAIAANERPYAYQLHPDWRQVVTRLGDERGRRLKAEAESLRQQLASSAQTVARVQEGLAQTFDDRARWDVSRAEELHARAAAARRYAESEREAARRLSGE